MAEERGVVALRAKLEALSYRDSLDYSSAPLVQKLVDDLLHSRQEYVALKQQAGKLAGGQARVADEDRVQAQLQEKQAENNQLHMGMIRESEAHDRWQKQHYQTVKRLEDRVAELSYWKAAAGDKMAAVEREDAALRRKVDELVRLNDRLTGGQMDPAAAAAKILVSHPLTPSSARPPAPRSPAAVNALHAADARISALQAALTQRGAELSSLSQQLADAHRAIEARDAEIARLGAGPGAAGAAAPGAGAAGAASTRAQRHEELILQLSETVDSLNAELAAATGRAAGADRLERSLAEATKAREAAEAGARAALSAKAGMESELQQLRSDLEQLRGAGSASTESLRSQLEGALSERMRAGQLSASLQRELDGVHAALSDAQSQASAASVCAHAALADAQFQASAANARAASSMAESEARTAELSSARSSLAVVQSQLDDCRAQLEELRVTRGRAQVERSGALSRLEELQQRLEAVEAAAAQHAGANVALGAQLGGLRGEVAAKAAALAACQADLNSAREQLSSLHAAAAAAEGAAGSSSHQASAAQVALGALQGQLADERAALQATRNAAASAQLDVARLSAQLEVLEADKASLAAQLSDARSKLASGQAAWSNAAAELAGAHGLSARVEDLTAQLRASTTRLASAEGDSARSREDAARADAMAARAAEEVSELRRALGEDAMRHRSRRVDRRAEELAPVNACWTLAREAASDARHAATEAQSRADGAHAELARAHGELERLGVQAAASADELHALRSRLEAEARAALDADVTAKDEHLRAAAYARQLAAKQEELEGLARAHEQARKNAESATARQEEARQAGRHAAERARRAEALAQEREADVAHLRGAREADHVSLRRLEEEAADLRAHVDARRSEVEQLTTLSLRGDATVQECMASVKALSGELRAAELRIQDLVGDAEARGDELHRTRLERDDLKRLVAGLDAERDALQDQLDTKAERLASMGEALTVKTKQFDELSRLLSMAEGRLNHTEARARDNDTESTNLRDQLGATLDNLRGLAGEHESMRAELRAAHEDLEALVRENQALGSELSVVVRTRDTQADELRRLSARAAAAEQLVRAKDAEVEDLRQGVVDGSDQLGKGRLTREKDAEVEDLRQAYEALALQARRLESTAAQLEREAALREQALWSRGDEVASLHEANRSAAAQISQYVVDLQAFERQADALSRALAKAESELEERARGREILLEETRSASGVRVALERQREELQRQLAAMDSQLAIAHARLDDAGSEAASLGQRLALERNRVSELEALLAGMRAREYRSDLSSSKSGSQLSIMQERNRILEQQVGTLQHQVSELHQSRDAQDAELGRLRNEALSLAASTGSAEAQSIASVQALQRQGAASEARARELGQALGTLRLEREELVAQLESARAQAGADAAATRAQMESSADAKAALVRELRAAQQQLRQAGPAGDVAVAAELAVAPRLVAQLEQQVATLKGEVARLSSELSAARRGDGSGVGSGGHTGAPDALQAQARFAADRGQMITIVSAYSPTEAASDEEAGDFYLRVAALADKANDKRDLLIVAAARMDSSQLRRPAVRREFNLQLSDRFGLLEAVPPEGADAQAEYDAMAAAIREVATNHLAPRGSRRRRGWQFTLSQRTLRLMDARQCAHTAWLRSKSAAAKRERNRANRAADAAVQRDRERWIGQQVAEAQDMLRKKNLRQFARACDRLAGRSRSHQIPPAMRDVSGALHSGPDGVLKAMTESFDKLYGGETKLSDETLNQLENDVAAFELTRATEVDEAHGRPPDLAETEACAARLAAQLREEQLKRRQTERDFLDLVESIEGGGGGDEEGGDGVTGVAARRLAGMQAKLEDLEHEKAALEDNVAATTRLMHQMKAELQNIHADYGVASATLEEMAAGMGGAGAPHGTASWGGSSFVLSIPVARGANWFLAGGGRRMDEEEATAAAAERIAAAAEDGTSLPVRLATDVVRFLYGGTGRREPADGGVVSASLLNAKPAVGGIGVEPRGGGVLRVLFTVASDAVADTVVRWRHELRRCVDSTAVFDVLSDREEAQHQALWPAFLAAKVAGKRAQFHRARLVVDGERVPAPAC
ncbi:hypothetical protein FOA52_002490 [Chlamydomonas sp. UWO 241]|nr:hypothetical protein FOA52_002490 [Chlamydomonas sp. UWO 241]